MATQTIVTKDDIEGDGGVCELVSLGFWECTDKNDVTWWCSSGGCAKAPAAIIKNKGDQIRDLIEGGAKCVQVSKDLTICLTRDGEVWSCQHSHGGLCQRILTPLVNDGAHQCCPGLTIHNHINLKGLKRK